MSITVPCEHAGLSPTRTYVYPTCGGWGGSVEIQSPDALLSVRTGAQIAVARAAINALCWPSSGRPSAGPGASELDITDGRWDGVGAHRIDAYTVSMPLGATSRMYHLRHAQRPSTLVLYNHGHGDTAGYASAVDAVQTHRRWYQAGCDTVALAMPSLGDNLPPVHPTAGVLTDHQLYTAIADDTAIAWDPTRLFVEPIVRVLNELAPLYSRIVMNGLSGGGWTTGVAAAMDERIDWSFPTSGSQPWYLREPNDYGDFEQQWRGLLDIANYLDQYVMACSSGRNQYQVLNRHDHCCFRHFPDYADAVMGAVGASGGGRWDYLIDTTHDRHAVSIVAMASMLALLDLGAL